MPPNKQKRTLEFILSAKNRTAQAFARVSKSLTRLRDTGRRALSGVSSAFSGVRAQVLALGAAVGGIQKLVIEPAQFDASLQKIATVGDAFAAQIDRIQRSIEGIAVSTGTAREDLALAFENAAKRTDTYAESLATVETANKLAALSGQSVSESVTILANTMKAFGGSVDDIEMQAAKLFETTRNLPESSQAIATAIGQIGPQAAAAGLSFDDLLASIIAAEKNGVRATQTISTLKQLLANLVDPAGQAATHLETLGVNIGSGAFEGEKFGEVLARIIRRAELAEIPLRELGFSGETLGTSLAIAANNGRDFQDALARIDGSSIDEFNEAFDRVNETTDSSIKAFKELTKVAAQAFGGVFLEDIGDRLGRANSMVDRIRKSAELAGLQFKSWAAALKPLINIFSLISSGISVIVSSLDFLLSQIAMPLRNLPVLVDLVMSQIQKKVLEFQQSLPEFSIGPIKFGDGNNDELEADIAKLEKRIQNLAAPLVGDVFGQAGKLDDDVLQLLTRLEDAALQSSEAMDDLFAPRVDRELQAQIKRVKKELEELRELEEFELNLTPAFEEPIMLPFDVMDQLDAALPGEPVFWTTFTDQGIEAIEEIAESIEAQIPEAARNASRGFAEAFEGVAVRAVIPFELPQGQLDAFEEEAEKAAKAVEVLQKRIETSFESAFASAFRDFIIGAKTAKEAFADFARSVISNLAQIAGQRLASQIFGGLFSNIFTAGSGGGGGGTIILPDGNAVDILTQADGGVNPGKFQPIATFADGGVLGGTFSASSASLPSLPFQALATGGIVREPTLGLIREAGQNEAVIPLVSGDRVPLEMTPQGLAVTLPGNRTIPAAIEETTSEPSLGSMSEKIQAFATGGIATRGSMALIREAGQNEAIVPLLSGDRVPLEVTPEGLAVKLPGDRSIPAVAPNLKTFAEGGLLGAKSASNHTRYNSNLRTSAPSQTVVENHYHYNIDAVDGQSVAAFLSRPEARRQIEANHRASRITRRDYQR